MCRGIGTPGTVVINFLQQYIELIHFISGLIPLYTTQNLLKFFHNDRRYFI